MKPFQTPPGISSGDRRAISVGANRGRGFDEPTLREIQHRPLVNNSADSEARLCRVLRAAFDGIWEFDVKTGIVWWNETYDELFGPRPRASNRSQHWWIDHIHSQDRRRVLASLNAVLTNESQADRWQEEYRFRRSDGSFVVVNDRVHIQRNESGEPAQLVGAMLDVTAMRESEHRYRAVVNASADAIIGIDGHGVITQMNPATERMFGYTAGELVGQHINALTSPPYCDEDDVPLARGMRTGEAHPVGVGREVEGKRKDGTTFPVDLAVIEIDERHCFTGTFRDLTERTRAESRLRDAERLALIGNLAAGLSHDMSNVILPLRSHLQVLEQSELPDGAKVHLTAVAECVTALRGIAKGIRQLVQKRPHEEKAQEIELKSWWERAQGLVNAAVTRGVSLEQRIASGLCIRAAESDLTRAILNLVVNAAEAIADSAQAGGRIIVWAHPSEDGSEVLVGVRDNGPGIPPEMRERVFEPFFTTKHGLSTGLGMSIVSAFVAQAGGSVTADSKNSVGTDIVMRLPATQRQLAHVQTAAPVAETVGQ